MNNSRLGSAEGGRGKGRMGGGPEDMGSAFLCVFLSFSSSWKLYITILLKSRFKRQRYEKGENRKGKKRWRNEMVY